MTKGTHNIVFVALDGLQALDLFGPLEVFATAKATAGCTYHWAIGSFQSASITTESGSKLLPDVVLEDSLEVDTLVFCGGAGPRQAVLSDKQVNILRTLCGKSQRIVSICTGAFLLERLGLTAKRNVTTHWQFTDDLALTASAPEVDASAIFVRDGNVWSSAGVTTGIDLSLALVTDDYGPAVATAVSQHLVVYMRRTGGQAQFSAPLRAQVAASGRLAPVISWITQNLDEDLAVPRLAARAGLSDRQFSRIFTQELGRPPAKYIEDLRLDKARIMLAERRYRIEDVAQLAGYKNTDNFRRAFIRKFAVSPSLYQKQFSTS